MYYFDGVAQNNVIKMGFDGEIKSHILKAQLPTTIPTGEAIGTLTIRFAFQLPGNTLFLSGVLTPDANKCISYTIEADVLQAGGSGLVQVQATNGGGTIVWKSEQIAFEIDYSVAGGATPTAVADYVTQLNTAITNANTATSNADTATAAANEAAAAATAVAEDLSTAAASQYSADGESWHSTYNSGVDTVYRFTLNGTDYSEAIPIQNMDLTAINAQISALSNIGWDAVSDIVWHNGAYWNPATNAAVNDGTSAYSDPVTVTPGDIYKITTTHYYDARAFVIRDADDVVLAYYPSSNATAEKVTDYEFTIPASGANMILFKYLGSNPALVTTFALSLRVLYADGAALEPASVDTPSLKDAAVTPAKLTAAMSAHFVDVYTSQEITWNTGYFVDYRNLTITAATGYAYSDTIEVAEGDKFFVTGTYGWYANLYVLTDLGGNKVTAYPNSYGGQVSVKNVAFTIPAGVTGIVLNQSPSTTTILRKATSLALKNELSGKLIAYNGDSICAGDGNSGESYPEMIAFANAGTYEKRAIGGGRLSNTGTHLKICNDVTNMSASADIVCFEGGINDFWGGVALGTLDTSGSTRFTAAVDNTTFAGALDTIFRLAIARWPGKPIGFIITHPIQNTAYEANSIGQTYIPYYNMIVAACEKYAIPYCDLFKNSMFNCHIAALSSAYTNEDDGTHPNDAGYRAYYVPQITAFLKKLVTV